MIKALRMGELIGRTTALSRRAYPQAMSDNLVFGPTGSTRKRSLWLRDQPVELRTANTTGPVHVRSAGPPALAPTCFVKWCGQETSEAPLTLAGRPYVACAPSWNSPPPTVAWWAHLRHGLPPGRRGRQRDTARRSRTDRQPMASEAPGSFQAEHHHLGHELTVWPQPRTRMGASVGTAKSPPGRTSRKPELRPRSRLAITACRRARGRFQRYRKLRECERKAMPLCPVRVNAQPCCACLGLETARNCLADSRRTAFAHAPQISSSPTSPSGQDHLLVGLMGAGVDGHHRLRHGAHAPDGRTVPQLISLESELAQSFGRTGVLLERIPADGARCAQRLQSTASPAAKPHSGYCTLQREFETELNDIARSMPHQAAN